MSANRARARGAGSEYAAVILYGGVLWLITHPDQQTVVLDRVRLEVARGRMWWETVRTLREIAGLPEINPKERFHREHSS